ncbi:hypothetical protein HanXRQr2_Chr09g0371701 [Helianthus annuus]|uniref:Uncharacterized protein n=1 Tax=Helianthus annuus TaxID=4232 RepID=A0A9K3I3R4_HELAN|nr:hypothetical protein HanXRQr2_Chr09g0371701 [Helianthus annuus]KAJ0891786.1 hypothetical protein HanPSC8_Chr09g0358151 [Helianthus annuus]
MVQVSFILHKNIKGTNEMEQIFGDNGVIKGRFGEVNSTVAFC